MKQLMTTTVLLAQHSRRFALLCRVARSLLVAILLVAPAATLAQEDRCIHKFPTFPSGSNTMVLKGTIKGKQCYVYRFNAREGQTLTVHLASRGAEFRVSSDPGICCAPEGSIGGGVTDWSGELPATGHYDVFVSSTGKGSSVPYTLKITVE